MQISACSRFVLTSAAALAFAVAGMAQDKAPPKPVPPVPAGQKPASPKTPATKPAAKPSTTTPAATPAVAPAATTPPAAAPETPPTPRKVVEGPVSVYTWEPPDDSRIVDAKNINLARVFQDMGPIATQWYQHVVTLSNPVFEGRAPGTRGNELAAEYVEFWMKQAGLEPAFPPPASDGATPSTGDWTSYRQKFVLPGGAPRVLSAAVKAGDAELKQGTDFSVLALSGDSDTQALPVVFAGYAIEKGKDDFTSFAEADDLKGKAVVFFRYEPLDEKGKSRWSDRRFSEHSGMLPKIEALVKRGAAAIVMVAPPGAVDGRQTLEDVGTSRWGRRIDVPVIQLSGKAAERLLQAGGRDKRSLLEWRQLADEAKVKTVPLESGATLTIQTKLDSGGTPAQNVAGVLRGKGALADEWVIVGAHYDHVGYGYFGTAPENTGKLHPGADDNASGTSAMLVLAQQVADLYASKDAPTSSRSVLFMGFTAEESGLHGSKWWVEHPTIKADKLMMMLNMDMVGRLRSDTLAAYGTGTAEGFLDIMRPIFERSGLEVHADPSGRGPSDHASFYGAGIPVIFINTGNHKIYHTPADKGYTMNPEGAAKVVALGKDIVASMATRPERLVFRSTDNDRTADRGYAGVRLGVMPAMGAEDESAAAKHPKGVMVDGVSADTAASEAGIKKGDILMSWDGSPLDGAGAMMAKLRDCKPGQVVKVVVWRDGHELPLDVTLRASKPRE